MSTGPLSAATTADREGVLDIIYDSPWSTLLFGFGLLAFVIGEIRGTRLVVRGLKGIGHPDRDFWLIRGVRAWVVGIAFLFVGAGAYFHTTWAVLFGLVFLGEELLETGTYLVVLRSARKREMRERSEAGQSVE